MFDRLALSTGYQPYEDLTVGKMNHQWSDEKVWHGSPGECNAGVMLAQQGSSMSQAVSGGPANAETGIFLMWNVGVMLAQKGSSMSQAVSSGPAQIAEQVNFQVQGQFSSGSLGSGSGAGGNFRDAGQVVDGNLGKNARARISR